MDAAVPLKRLLCGIRCAVTGIFPHKRLQDERMGYAQNLVGLAFKRKDYLIKKRSETGCNIVKRLRSLPCRNIRACPLEKVLEIFIRVFSLDVAHPLIFAHSHFADPGIYDGFLSLRLCDDVGGAVCAQKVACIDPVVADARRLHALGCSLSHPHTAQCQTGIAYRSLQNLRPVPCRLAMPQEMDLQRKHRNAHQQTDSQNNLFHFLSFSPFI